MIIRSAATLLAFCFCATMVRADYTLHILHIGDFSSRIEPVNAQDSSCSAKDKAAEACFGGIARIAAKVAELRDALQAQGQNVILLDTGDQLQGSLLYAAHRGAVEAEFMQRIGFDAMALGDHEFDEGPEGLRRFLDLVDFPVISGNVDVSRSAALEGRIARHVVLDVGGERIGLVSALTTDTAETSGPGPDIVFMDPALSLAAEVAALEAKGVNKIIALTHVGLAMDKELAADVEGIDAIIGGHSRTVMSNSEENALAYPQMVGDVPVAHAYAYGKYLGHLVLQFDDAGHVTSASGDTILLDESVTPDPAIAARVAELAGPFEEIKQRVVAVVASDIDGRWENCRTGECEMGNLVADAVLAHVRRRGVGIAILNSGGLRASLPAGPVTVGHILGVLPFQDTLSTFKADGTTVLAALENGFSQVDSAAGRFPQVAGIRVIYDPEATPGSRVVSAEVRDGDRWVPLDPSGTYFVVTNDYLRGGGDGYVMFGTDGRKAHDHGPNLADVLANYLAVNSPYRPFLDGRIKTK